MKWFITAAILVLAVSLAGPTQALEVLNVIIDNPSGLPTDFSIDPDGETVDILIHTYWDPTFDPTLKVFETDGTAGTIHLVETVHNHLGEPWHDWHEQLLVPDGTGGWVPSPDTDNLWWGDPGVNSGAGATVNPAGDIFIDHPKDLMSFYWDPYLAPSTTITITKDILVPEGTRLFAVAEWPSVPEPSVIAIAGFGLLGLLRRRRK